MEGKGVAQRVPVAVTGASGGFAVTEGWLTYRDNDPYVVTFEIGQPYTEDETVTWTMGRELLAAGACSSKPVGQGELQIWRCDEGRGLHFELNSPDGTATLHVSLGQIDVFLCESYNIVAEGDESLHMNIDDVIGRILEGA
jgi:hypothetical protein